MFVDFQEVATQEQLKELAELADHIWKEYFPCILAEDQINYMVKKFQSYEAMQLQIKEQGYSYYFIQWEDKKVGYLGVKPEGERLFLSKLYLKKEARGKGLASRAFKFLDDFCKKRKMNRIYLTVNKYNNHSIEVYKAKGFHNIKSQVQEIGNGYIMDDYIMEKIME